MEPIASYNIEERNRLLEVAFNAIAGGLRQEAPADLEPSRFPTALQAMRASFVTLKITDQLRGCIGTLEAIRPLVEDVYANAFAAAYRDPRFPPVTETELDALDISISVLSTPEPLSVDSEQELISLLRPGIDGLILEEGYHRGTFLPAVWESLAEPWAFVRQLKMKAGIPVDHWSRDLKVYRYHTEVIGDA